MLCHVTAESRDKRNVVRGECDKTASAYIDEEAWLLLCYILISDATIIHCIVVCDCPKFVRVSSLYCCKNGSIQVIVL